MNPYLAKRIQKINSETFRSALRLAATQNIIDFTIGYPLGDTPDYIKRAGMEAIRKNKTSYTPANGTTELRAAVADKLARDNAINSSLESITITPGATSAILITYLAVLEPDDEVLLPEPYFPPYKDLAEMLGAKIRYVNTQPSFVLTAAMVKSHITSKTKLLIINSPNNPTGAVYPKEELIKIADIAKKHKLLVISDEVYEYFTYEKPHFSIGSVYSNTLTINSLSKSYSMTGWRLGYIHGPIKIIEAINELLQYAIFASSSIAQHAALTALSNPPPKFSDIYRPKRDMAISLLEKTFPRIRGGDGAFYLFLKLPNHLKDAEATKQLRDVDVAVLPGGVFSRSSKYIRISYAMPNAKLQAGIKRIVRHVESLKT